jgi:hypothetical protein
MAPAPIALQKCFGVARAEPIDVRAQLIADRAVIVDFAVRGDNVTSHGIRHRLRTGGRKIDNRQTRAAEPASAIWRSPFAARVRPAMMNEIEVERRGPP